jgi:PTS system mannose-specific IIC component
LFAVTPDDTAAAMSMAALAALIMATIGGTSMVALRRWNADWARRQRERIARGSGPAVVGLQLAGMTADLLRGGVLTLVALLVFNPLRTAILGTFSFPGTLSRAVVVSVASAVGLAAVWKVTHGTAGARWWLLGGLVFGFGIAWGLW